jgi:hypothetical protein
MYLLLTSFTLKAAPPRESPSSLVRIAPVMPTSKLNDATSPESLIVHTAPPEVRFDKQEMRQFLQSHPKTILECIWASQSGTLNPNCQIFNQFISDNLSSRTDSTN